MDRSVFTDRDLEQLAAAGLLLGEALRQLALFENPPKYAKLARACTAGDGIRRLGRGEIEEDLAAFERARLANRLMKFVPASGAATRMFQSLLRFHGDDREWSLAEIEAGAAKGDVHCRELKRFLDHLDRFPFAGRLREGLAAAGLDFDGLRAEGRYRPILEELLAEEKIGYGNLPKGLILFHHHESGARTPFEQHLVESALYARNHDGVCRLHFTVSPEHEAGFREVLERARGPWEKEFGLRFDVGFSVQKSSTDTLAADENNRPFRDADGRLLLRPGGHGALIENLNDLHGDVVFIKNIDNVTPRQLVLEVYAWKKTLAGHLVRVQEKVFRLLDRLDAGGADEALVGEGMRFLAESLSVLPPPGRELGPAEKREFLLRKLDRPIRVCGMVPNAGDPGGGPFWVVEPDDAVGLQIVESAQIDPNSPKDQAILRGSTHFNPVDLVCGLRDRHGRPYDLLRHVDESAVFISHKSKDAKPLKALERPGLWNGAMADWNTIFIEVPAETFSPVKRVTDLLKAEHQG